MPSLYSEPASQASSYQAPCLSSKNYSKFCPNKYVGGMMAVCEWRQFVSSRSSSSEIKALSNSQNQQKRVLPGSFALALLNSSRSPSPRLLSSHVCACDIIAVRATKSPANPRSERNPFVVVIVFSFVDKLNLKGGFGPNETPTKRPGHSRIKRCWTLRQKLI